MDIFERNVKQPVEKTATLGALTLTLIVVGVLMSVIILLLYAFG